MGRLRIFIDRDLKTRFGPEICWTWRTILTGIGCPWEEADHMDSQCDVAYVRDPSYARNARVVIRMDPNRWSAGTTHRFQKVEERQGFPCLVLAGEDTETDVHSSSDGRFIFNKDIVFDVFWIVTGQAEKVLPRDRHGFFDITESPSYRNQVMRDALASRISAQLEKCLEGPACPEKLPRWPLGKKASVALTHDVDYPVAKRFIEPFRLWAMDGFKGFRSGLLVLAGKKTYWNFARWMELEKSYGFKSAFYFTSRKGSLVQYALGRPDPFYDVRDKRYRQLFSELSAEGFEVGLHASYHAYKNSQTLSREREILREASGQEVAGNRHHYWHLDPSDPECTLLLHEMAGFKYDTSLCHDRYLGFRRGFSWPFFPLEQKQRKELKTLQIPTAWMDDHLFGHAKANPGDWLAQLSALFAVTLHQGGCFAVDVHDYCFDEEVFPGRQKIYRWLLDRLTSSGEFWVAMPGEIADHWIKRYQTITGNSLGLTL